MISDEPHTAMTVRRRRLLAAFLADQQGAALLEFSIVASMLIIMIFGTINWARYFHLHGQMADAVRDSARYAATKKETADDSSVVADYARTLIANSTTDSLSGTLAVTYVGTAGTDRRVRVALTSFPFTRIAPLGMTARTISVAAEFRREQP
jgi:Flp pilus assembly protein TadG